MNLNPSTDTSNDSECIADSSTIKQIDISESNILSPIESQIITCVIIETLNQLSIISDINQKKEPINPNIENNFQTVDSECDNQIRKTIENAKEILEELVEGLQKGSIESLQIHNAEDARNILKNEILFISQDELELKLDKSKSDLKKDKCQAMNDYKNQTELIGKLKDEYEDLVHESEIKYNYIDKWQSSREWQSDYKIRLNENKLAQIKANHEKGIVRESRIHDEINSYYVEILDDYENTLTYWQEKYKHDFEDKEKCLKNIREKKATQAIEIANLSTVFKQREEEINNYNKFKQEKKEAAERLKVMQKAATTIQAWWKGLMFRKKLGQYRLKKSKGKDGKKGSKKGTAKK